MKQSAFLIFFSIVLVIYALFNTFLYYRTSSMWGQKYVWYAAVFTILALAYPVARILERSSPGILSTAFLWIGSFWLALMVYIFLFVILYELLRIPGIPNKINNFGKIYFLGMMLISFIVVIAGHFNARNPRITTIEIPMAVSRPYTLVMASDLHLGTLVGKYRLGKLVDLIQSQNPDMVIFAGDVLDEDVGPAIRQNLGGLLSELNPPLGKWAITGNHEYYGGLGESLDFLKDNGVHVLMDTFKLIDNQFIILGRKDKESNRITGKNRKEIHELLENIPEYLPIILLDHQPFGLQEIADAGIRLSLSGHTHHGQLWPFQYLTKKIFELSHGLLKKQETYFYVSCGAGTWGPAVRTSSRPEIVRIQIIPQIF
ncbi:MAG: metallophosphoesterase [Bacteroidales bacterium]|nr:metallophosphoesterase [Bacteroidales bacterium]